MFNNFGKISTKNNRCSDKFLGKNAQPIAFSKEESIDFIKCTGRMHELLTGIMDQLNQCYALQVR